MALGELGCIAVSPVVLINKVDEELKTSVTEISDLEKIRTEIACLHSESLFNVSLIFCITIHLLECKKLCIIVIPFRIVSAV